MRQIATPATSTARIAIVTERTMARSRWRSPSERARSPCSVAVGASADTPLVAGTGSGAGRSGSQKGLDVRPRRAPASLMSSATPSIASNRSPRYQNGRSRRFQTGVLWKRSVTPSPEPERKPHHRGERGELERDPPPGHDPADDG